MIELYSHTFWWFRKAKDRFLFSYVEKVCFRLPIVLLCSRLPIEGNTSNDRTLFYYYAHNVWVVHQLSGFWAHQWIEFIKLCRNKNFKQTQIWIFRAKIRLSAEYEFDLYSCRNRTFTPTSGMCEVLGLYFVCFGRLELLAIWRGSIHKRADIDQQNNTNILKFGLELWERCQSWHFLDKKASVIRNKSYFE